MHATKREHLKQVFSTFLKLGLTSFGGPIAHIGYFRTEFVERKNWLSDAQFSQLLAICQFLPGPASSQLGFCIGLQRAGWLGALAAFLAFTLPSVVLLLLFAQLLPIFDGQIGESIIHGFKILACAIVLDALVGMFKNLCNDNRRRAIAAATFVFLLFISTASAQIIAVAIAAMFGAFYLSSNSNKDYDETIQVDYGKATGTRLLIAFAALLVGLPLLASSEPNVFSVADAFYKAGALVFGGGHVVLPLLEESVVSHGWINPDQFLAGYGASQAIPGPMFAFSAYLGALISSESSLFFASIAVLFMFLPGFLLVASVLPFWQVVAEKQSLKNAIAGINAAVVGLLAAALYDPIMITAIQGYSDGFVALIAITLIIRWRLSPLLVMLWCVFATIWFRHF